MKKERRVFTPGDRLAIIQEGQHEGATVTSIDFIKIHKMEFYFIVCNCQNSTHNLLSP